MAPLTAHPYDPATVDAGRPANDSHPRHYRAAIIATYHGPTDRRGATWRATLRRSPSERPASATVASHEGPDAAVAALIAKLGLSWRMLPATGSPDGAGRYVYVAELAAGEGQALAAGERAVLALLLAAELEALAAGAPAADLAEPWALPVAIARMATGTDRPRPVVTGWRTAGDSVAVLDHLGRELFRTPPHLSGAGALACAQAAGWQLCATARATAARHAPAAPDPEGLAIAIDALGGCPAVSATLRR